MEILEKKIQPAPMYGGLYAKWTQRPFHHDCARYQRPDRNPHSRDFRIQRLSDRVAHLGSREFFVTHEVNSLADGTFRFGPLWTHDYAPGVAPFWTVRRTVVYDVDRDGRDDFVWYLPARFRLST